MTKDNIMMSPPDVQLYDEDKELYLSSTDKEKLKNIYYDIKED